MLVGDEHKVGTRPLVISDLGIMDYAESWELQHTLVSARTRDLIPDTLLLLEHPHTVTFGRGGGRDNLLASGDEIQERGVTVLDVDRGGDVTYHGPGQLVAYPILNLAQHPIGRDFRAYIRRLEQVLIDTLAHFGIRAGRVEGLSGAWVTRDGLLEKIGAVGVKVDGRSITSHGIALNVATDLSFFDLIVPCGIRGKGVTSIHKLLDSAPAVSAVKPVFAGCFANRFGFGELS